MIGYKQIGEDLFIKRTDESDKITHRRTVTELKLLSILPRFILLSGILYYICQALFLSILAIVEHVIFLLPIFFLLYLFIVFIKYWILDAGMYFIMLTQAISTLEIRNNTLHIKKLGFSIKKIKIENIIKILIDENSYFNYPACILKNGSKVNLGIQIIEKEDFELLKALILHPSTCISLVNKAILPKVIVNEKRTELILRTTDYELSLDDEIRLFLVGVGAIACYFLDYWYIRVFLIAYIVGALQGRLYKLYKRLQVPKVTVSSHGIDQGCIGYVFGEKYKIKKRDIALISTSSWNNQFTIKIVSQSGDIQELPIAFESEVAAAEQVAKMKELLELE